MKKTLIIYISIFILLVIPVFACKPIYGLNEDVVIIDSIESSGSGALCNITIYNTTALVDYDNMTQDGRKYYYNASILPEGTYNSIIECNKTDVIYTGGCDFKVYEENKMIIGMIILIPLVLSMVLLASSYFLSEEHNVLKIFLFLLSIIPFFISLHMGAVSLVKFYNFTALEEIIGNTTYWFTVIFGAIVSYFCIYLIYKGFKQAKAKKIERLEY